MELFDKFKNAKTQAMLNQLIDEDYEQNYYKQCCSIWNNFVPKKGQSTVLQGELLRAVENLRCEAQDNGNINWDSNYVYFCDFLNEKLCSQDIFSDEEKENYSLILDYLKYCGEYAVKVQDGEFPDEDIYIDDIAYVDDNLYDILADAVGKFYESHPEPIPYETNPNIYR